MVAEQVDRRDQRLRLERQQAGGTGEVVAVGLGVDVDLVALHLRVQHVAAAAEVDDVQHVEVLAQLLVGHLEALAHVRDLRLARPRGRTGSGCRRARPAARSAPGGSRSRPGRCGPARPGGRSPDDLVGARGGEPARRRSRAARRRGARRSWTSRSAVSSTSSDGSSSRACSPRPSTHAIELARLRELGREDDARARARGVTRRATGLPDCVTGCEVAVRPKSRSTSHAMRSEIHTCAVPSGSPSCQSARRA